MLGSAVPLLVTWLVVDRLADRRWWKPVIVVALLAWALVADPLVLWAGVVPLAVACAARAYHQLAVERRPVASARPDLALAAAAVLAIPGSIGGVPAYRAHGGYGLLPLATQTIPGDGAGAKPDWHAGGCAGAVRRRFPRALTARPAIALVAVHLVGLGLAVWGVAVAIRRFPRDTDRVVQIFLPIAVLAIVTAMVISGRATSLHPTDGGRHGTDAAECRRPDRPRARRSADLGQAATAATGGGTARLRSCARLWSLRSRRRRRRISSWQAGW